MCNISLFMISCRDGNVFQVVSLLKTSEDPVLRTEEVSKPPDGIISKILPFYLDFVPFRDFRNKLQEKCFSSGQQIPDWNNYQLSKANYVLPIDLGREIVETWSQISECL